ncbi:MAG: SpoIID/LytB domain-containing protein, partial [Ruminococcaceae bacterium]|nr:SpoIID/LytB domain-containing protein [Oscillospiraceae bacterium]
EATGQGTQDFLLPDNNLADPVTPEKTNQTTTIDIVNFGHPSIVKQPVSVDFVPGRLTEKLPSASTASSSSSEDVFVIEPQEPDPPPVSTFTPDDIPKPVESEPSSSSTTVSEPETSEPDTSDASDTSETSEPSSSTSSSTSSSSSSTTSEPTSSSTSSSSSSSTLPVQPNEVITNTAAANEILSVSVNGDVVSGTALDIVSGIVANEVGGAFAPEAIKAQAVAAYTYIKYFNLRGSTPSAYLNEPSDSIKVLVASVIGEAIYYNGEIIQATYSASSAGCTASSANVWGTDLPYLQSVYCELDAQYDPNYGKTKRFKADDIKSRVYSTTGISLNGDPSGWFNIESRNEGKYVGKMSVGGYHTYIDSYGDTVTITGRVFRERIMSFDVRSSAFDINYDSGSNEFVVTTYGYGHGVGMSQNGANALATYLGWNYKDILTFYYTGTTVR